MNKSFKKIILFLAVIATAFGMSSCSSKLQIVPKAVNTVNTVHFEELNLARKDYNIINTITAEATIKYKEKFGDIIIEENNSEFKLKFGDPKQSLFGPKPVTREKVLKDFEGVVRLGFLTNDYANGSGINYESPEDLGRRLAIYRLINVAKEEGADGLIEPLVSTNVEQIDKEIIFTTIVSAKCVKIKAY